MTPSESKTRADSWDKWRGPTVVQLGRAAAWCSIDDETDEEIAARLGVCRRTLARWKQRLEFRAASVAVLEYMDEEWRRAMMAKIQRGA